MCDGFGRFRMILSSTISTDLDASGITLLTSGFVSLEMVVEFLVVSLKTNLAHDKDTNTLVLSFSNQLDKWSALFPGTQQLFLAPGDFLATKDLDTSHRLTVQVWSLLQHQLQNAPG